jgi:FdhD protein
MSADRVTEPGPRQAGAVAQSHRVIRCKAGERRAEVCEFLGEEPLLIRIEGKPYSVVMRTPGEELVHAAGFCLGEGIADSLDDFLTIGYCRDLDPNVIEVRLKPERREKIGDLLERRGFVSQTSCGICGKEMVEDIYQVVAPIADPFRVSIGQVLKCIDRLCENQLIHRRTRGAHAAMLIDRRLEMISFAEDVGRHNALDKAIGKAFVARKLSEAVLLILSSRISFEMVQKAARARLPIVVGMSRPTALAAEMGRALTMTLACTARQSELIIVCGEERISFDAP